MIRRIDRLATELPPPSDPDPDGTRAVQELLGGRFGEMSTLMNHTFQSLNFRNRQGATAAEEYGHMKVVSATINTMQTGVGRVVVLSSCCLATVGQDNERPNCGKHPGV